MNKYLVFLIIISFQNFSFAQTKELKQDSIAKIITKSFILSNKGNVEEALKLQNFALDWAKKHDNDSIRGEAYHCMAVVYSILEDNNKAKLLYSKSLAALKRVNHTSYITYHFNNMAEIYNMEGDTIKAISHYEMARTISLENNLIYNALWPTFNLAIYAFEKENYAVSSAFFNDVINLFEINTEHQPEMISQSYTYLARINDINGKTEKALENLEAAHQFGLENKIFLDLIEIEKIRFKIYSRTKNELKAKSSLLRQLTYQEENFKLATKQAKTNEILKKELLQNEKELEYTKKIHLEKIKTLTKTRYLIALLLLVISIIVYLLYKKSQNIKNID